MIVDTNSYRITAVGPAFSDGLLQLDEERYKNISSYLRCKPGDWTELKSINEVHKVLEICQGTRIELNAGSTLLGTLSALPIEMRKRSLIITSKGTSNEYISQMSFSKFCETAESLSLQHRYFEVAGANAVGLVFTSPRNSDKILAMYKGVSHNLVVSECDVCSDYLLVDAYELNGGAISDSIDKLIKSNRYKTALCLGNPSILQGNLLNLIITYLNKGLIHCLAGNKDEIKCLSGGMDIMDFISKEHMKKIPYILITLGEQGMIGSFHGRIYFQNAIKCNKIISTSGCGDVSLGVFLSGIVNGDNPVQILEKAAYYASAILKRKSNIFIEGIENVV